MSRDADFPHLGFDPAPGDPETIRQLLRVVGRVTRDGDSAQHELSRLGESDGIWAGKAATAFTESVSEVPPYLRNALTSLTTAQRALETWERNLTDYQARARKLEREAETAAQNVSAARAGVDGMTSNTDGMSDKEKDELEKDKKAKERALDSAGDELEGVRNRARALNAEFTGAGDDAARQISASADDAPPEPGWLEDVLGDIAGVMSDLVEIVTDPNLLKLIGDICADIAMVVGVVCLAIVIVGLVVSGVGVPFALGLIGVIAGAGALGFHAAAMAAGNKDVTWATLGWDAAGLLAGGIGLRGARLAQSGGRLIEAGADTVRAGEAVVEGGRALRASSGLLSKIRNFNWSPSSLLQGTGNSLRGAAQQLRGQNIISEGQQIIQQGQRLVSRGNFLDRGGLFSGLGAAGGSNMNDQRWLDGDFNISDLPVVGPISDFKGLEADITENTEVVAPEPFNPPQRLDNAGDSFTTALSQPRVGTAA